MLYYFHTMVVKLLISLICVSWFMFVGVKSQICTKRAVVTKWQQETYRYTYKETYRGDCWYGCIKTRYSSSTATRIVPKRKLETKYFCCDGYIGDNNSANNESLNCEPICLPTCINGFCKKPGECACNEGYTFDPTSNHRCIPVCENGCYHGICVAPNNCQCSFGYSNINGSCEPICTEPCENGICSAPDTCECNPGYRKSETNVCEPYCSTGCTNGRCIGPETCSCNEGWFKNESNGICIPRCDHNCGNGTCKAPNTCECFPGYQIDNNFKIYSTVCVPICKGCENGTCVGPGKCVCDLPFVAKYLSSSGGTCECSTNCSDSDQKCESTICVLKPVETTTLLAIVRKETTKQNEFYDETSSITISEDDHYLSTEVVQDSTKLNEGDQSEFPTVNTKLAKTTGAVLYDTTVPFNSSLTFNETNNHTYSPVQGKGEWAPVWIYTLVVIGVLLVILIIIGAIKKKSISNCFKGGSYPTQEGKLSDSTTTQVMDVSYSDIMHKRMRDYN